MKPYIYTERNGIYIIDLKKTLRLLRDAMRFVRDEVAEGKTVLFVGTKKQAKDIVAEAATRSGMYYVNNRWLGGLMTNFRTVRRSVDRLIELEELFADGRINQYGKKEQSALNREMLALRKNLDGIKNMRKLPDILFVIDPSKETIAIAEATTLHIPIVAVVDTNCDPDGISWVIPGNDDAIRSIRLMCDAIADASIDGQQVGTEGEFGGEDEGGEPAAVGAGQPLTAEELEARFNVYTADAPAPAVEAAPAPAPAPAPEATE